METRRVLDSLEQELQLLMSYLMRALGTEPGSFTRAISVLICQAIFLAPESLVFSDDKVTDAAAAAAVSSPVSR